MLTPVYYALVMPPVYSTIRPAALVDVIKTANLMPLIHSGHCKVFDNLHERCSDLNWIPNTMKYGDNMSACIMMTDILHNHTSCLHWIQDSFLSK